MGKLIQFPGSGRNNPEQLSEHLNENKLAELLETMTRLMGNMTGRQRIGLQRNNLNISLVALYEDSQIIHWVNISDESRCSTDPKFFFAIIEEARKRGLVRSIQE